MSIPKPKNAKKFPKLREELGSDFWYHEEDGWESGTKVELFTGSCFSNIPPDTYEMEDGPSVTIDQNSCIV